MCNYGYTIDFYTETFFKGTGVGFTGGMMEEMTTGNIVTCYNRYLRNTPKDHCPTKNIRWQAGDIRVAGDIMYDMFNKEDKAKFNIKSEKYLKNSYIEFQLYFLLVLLKLHFKFDNNVYKDTIMKILPKTSFKDIHFFKNFLLSLFDGENFDYKNFSNRLFSMMNKNNSAIYKQVKKQTYDNFNDIKKWEDFYAHSLKSYISIDSPSEYKNIILNLDKYLSGEINITRDDIFIMSVIQSDICVPLLDIYVISRMFKQPTGGKRSDLSFGYFGNDHVKNIKDLLLSTGIYEIVISKDSKHDINNVVNRCLDFSDIKLNLADELANHK